MYRRRMREFARRQGAPRQRSMQRARRRVSSTAAIQPQRALAHPVWWAALLTLVINDHILKQSNVAGIVTGKLSDVVGLLMAPVLLAVLCRVKTTRGLGLAHLAVGAVFALINISPAAASFVEGLTRLTPFGWTITVDPTDLLALPMLWVSHHYWSALSLRPVTPHATVTRFATAVGLLASVATSTEPPVTNSVGVVPAQSGVVRIANTTNQTLVLRVRQLRDTVRVDCSTLLAEDAPPLAEQLSRDLFAPAEAWEIAPNRALVIRGGATCGVFLVDGPEVDDFLLTAPTGSQQQLSTGWEGGADNLTVLVTSLANATAPVLFGPESHSRVHTAPPLNPIVPPTGCAVPGPEDGIDWSNVNAGNYVLESVSSSPDGCHRLTLQDRNTAWWICLAGQDFPFEPGDALLVTARTIGAAGGVIEGFDIRSETMRLRFGRGSDLVPFTSSSALIEVVPSECDSYHDACGALLHPVELRTTLGEDVVSIAPGATLPLSGGAVLALPRAMEMEVVSTECTSLAAPGLYVESVYVGPTVEGGNDALED